MRGSAGYLGEAELHQLCTELERDADAGRLDEVRARLPSCWHAGAFRRNNSVNRAHRTPRYNLLQYNSGDAMKVLIVDDDVVSRMMLMHMIDGAGSYDVLEAEDGEEAWRQLDGGARPAMLFCDLRMPRLSGMELLARVKADERFAGCRSCWSPPPPTAPPWSRRSAWAPTATSSSPSTATR
jgi:CheY-like chemotaxis protein